MDESYNDMMKNEWEGDVSVVNNLSKLQANLKTWKLNTIDQ
jgi:hypothetical protein